MNMDVPVGIQHLKIASTNTSNNFLYEIIAYIIVDTFFQRIKIDSGYPAAFNFSILASVKY